MNIVKFIFTLFFIFFSSYSVSIDKIESYKSIYYIGKYTEVCGTVSQIKNIRNQTYLNLDGYYPKQKLAIMIWNDNLNKIVTKVGKLSSLKNNRICVKGVIDTYKKMPQIILNNPNNIAVQ